MHVRIWAFTEHIKKSLKSAVKSSSYRMMIIVIIIIVQIKVGMPRPQITVDLTF